MDGDKEQELVIDIRENAIDNSFFQLLKKNLKTENLLKLKIFCDYNNISTKGYNEIMEIVQSIPENKLEEFAFENNNKENPLKIRN